MKRKYEEKYFYIFVFAAGIFISSLISMQSYRMSIETNQEFFERNAFKNVMLIEKSLKYNEAENSTFSDLSQKNYYNTNNIKNIIEDTIKAGGKAYVGLTIDIENNGRRENLYTSHEPGYPSPFYFYTDTIDLGNYSLFLTFQPTQYFLSTFEPKHPYILFAAITLLTVFSSFYLKQISKNVHELREAQIKAEEANRLKNEFLATMSHEIRSPMSGVLGMAELLMQTDQTPEQRSYTRTILNSGETLLDIIEDILDFSKIEADKLTLDPVALNMLELVDDVCALYAPKAREKALELAVRYVPGSEQFVYADPVRMRQVIGNLVNNAIKFTEKGYVIVTVREDKTHRDDGRINLMFTVEDTGIGIPEEAHQRIFEKFMQADSSTTRDFGGTGLGLSICKSLIELMEGQITVKSSAGQGSIFAFNIPLRRNQQETYNQPRPPVLKNTKILIVDDLSVIQTLLTEQLTLAGMRCVAVGKGEEAIEAMHKAAAISDPFKIVLIDYLLPGMNGEMLARAISDEQQFRNTCLVMLTAAGNPSMTENLARKGFSACLSKPISTNTLIETLAVVWSKYREGARDVLIKLDTTILGQEKITQDQNLIGTKILLAEDSRINQAFAQDVLEQMGCAVTIVTNGKEALDAVVHEPFDLVLMDCQMPIMDGFDASREITKLKANGTISQDMPIIALTANAMKGDRQRCLEAGMNDYLAKPVRTKDLREKIYFWIKRKNLKSNNDDTEGAHIISFGKRSDLDNILDISAAQEAQRLLKDKYPVMLNYFIEDILKYFQEIENAYTSGKVEAAMRPAHTIKSTSKRMGAAKLSELAHNMEVSTQQSGLTPEVLKNNLEEMKSVFEESQAALIQYQKKAQGL